MKIIFKLTKEKTGDLEGLKQFDICLLATRLTQPKARIIVQIPKTFYYPSTWQGLKDLGIKITKEPVVPLAEDIVSEGTHVPVARLSLRPLPNTPEHEMQPPQVETTLDGAVQWLEFNRTGDRIWLPIPAHNPYYWNSPPLETPLLISQWLEWAYWRKAQPGIHGYTRNMTAFAPRAQKILPPAKGI